MLWYKNWRETLPMLVYLQIFFVQFLFPNTWNIFSPDYSPAVFAVFMLYGFMFLGGSGIRTRLGFSRMKSNSIQSTLYTLSLPVTRRRLLLVRSALGLLEMAAISILLAALVLWIIGPRENLTVTTMGHTLLVVIAFGIGFYFFSTLLATFLRGAYFLLTCHCSFCLFVVLSERLGWLSAYLGLRTVLRSVSATGSLPWLQMVTCVVLGGICLFASIRIVEAQEY